MILDCTIVSTDNNALFLKYSMEQHNVPATETGLIPLTAECGALRSAAMEKIWHLQDYMTDFYDGAPHLPNRIVDYRPANEVTDETLAAYDAAVAAGAPMLHTRENVESMRKGAQRAYARRIMSKTYHAAIARITNQGDKGDPRTLLDEARKAAEDIPPQDHLLQGMESLQNLVMRACETAEEETL